MLGARYILGLAGILNPPFFDPAFPMAVNYGGMGVVMGHEVRMFATSKLLFLLQLTHGFDDEGVQWTGNGTLYNWIDNYSNYGFKKIWRNVFRMSTVLSVIQPAQVLIQDA